MRKDISKIRGFVFSVLSVCIVLYAGIACSDGEKDIDAAIDAVNDNDAYRAIVPVDAEPKLLLDGVSSTPGLTFTEGPSWMNGTLYFSNYYKFWKEWGSSGEGGLIRLTRDGRHTVLNRNVQTCGTMPLPGGTLAVCDLIQRSIVEMDTLGTILRTIVDSYEGTHLGMPNDLVVDNRGGIYFTDPNNSGKDNEKQPGNAVYYLDPDGTLTRLTGWNEFGFPNGIVLSPDGLMLYLNDSKSHVLTCWDVLPDGSVTNRREFADLSIPGIKPGSRKGSNADGMTIDTLGNLYVASGIGLTIIGPGGGLIGVIRFPESPSNCIFGGDDMRTLFATCRKRVYSIGLTVPGLSYPPVK